MTEIWKDVVGFEGFYQVSNLGRVKSIGRYDSRGRFWGEQLKKTKPNNRGYIQISFHKHGKEYYKLLHRVVAEAFIPNSDNLPQVNHIDEDKNNNAVENLEWCTNLYNRHYGDGYQRSVQNHDYESMGKRQRKAVASLDENGNILDVYDWGKEAADKIGTTSSAIQKACREGRRAKGLRWKYLESA